MPKPMPQSLENPSLVDTVNNREVLRALISGGPICRRGDAPAASSYQLATLKSIDLGAFPAASVIRASIRAGSVTGELTPQVFGATPTTTQVAVAPNGDIVVLGTDAPTDMDVTYVGESVDVVEFPNVTVASHVWAIPTSGKYTTVDGREIDLSGRKVVLLREAQALTGTLATKMIVLVPGAAPATTKANLNVAKTQVQFAVADAVTLARVRVAFGKQQY